MPRPKITDPAATASGLAVLRALDRYGYLTIRQLCTYLGYSYKAKGLNKLLTRLADSGYLFAGNSAPLPAPRRDGAAASVLCLTQRGQRTLTGEEEPRRPGQHNYVKKPGYLSHLLPLNDVLMTFDRFASQSPGYELLSFMHDQDLRRLQLAAIPDGYVAIGHQGETAGFAIEFDRGTERLSDPYQATTWQRKIEGLVELGRGSYRQVFPYESLQVAVVIDDVAGRHQQRLGNLVTWTEQILAGREGWGNFFRFTTANPTTMTPGEFIGGAHWVVPFSLQELPLIDV